MFEQHKIIDTSTNINIENYMPVCTIFAVPPMKHE